MKRFIASLALLFFCAIGFSAPANAGSFVNLTSRTTATNLGGMSCSFNTSTYNSPGYLQIVAGNGQSCFAGMGNFDWYYSPHSDLVPYPTTTMLISFSGSPKIVELNGCDQVNPGTAPDCMFILDWANASPNTYTGTVTVKVYNNGVQTTSATYALKFIKP